MRVGTSGSWLRRAAADAGPALSSSSRPLRNDASQPTDRRLCTIRPCRTKSSLTVTYFRLAAEAGSRRASWAPGPAAPALRTWPRPSRQTHVLSGGSCRERPRSHGPRAGKAGCPLPPWGRPPPAAPSPRGRRPGNPAWSPGGRRGNGSRAQVWDAPRFHPGGPLCTPSLCSTLPAPSLTQKPSRPLSRGARSGPAPPCSRTPLPAPAVLWPPVPALPRGHPGPLTAGSDARGSGHPHQRLSAPWTIFVLLNPPA